MSDDKLTDDRFLGGRVQLFQPARGFRSGVDAVLLAAAVPAKAGQSVLDLGCGAGAASLCLAARVPGLVHTGLEVQKDYADLAIRNAARNDLDMTVVEGDVSAMPLPLREAAFEHVFANPPYYRAKAHSPADDAGRATALGETAPLSAWIDGATRRLRPNGWLTIIQKAGRLRDLIDACDKRLGSLEIKPVSPRDGRPAELVILRARKGGRADLRIFSPLVMHRGAQHERDGESYGPDATAILRDGKTLDF